MPDVLCSGQCCITLVSSTVAVLINSGDLGCNKTGFEKPLSKEINRVETKGRESEYGQPILHLHVQVLC